MKNSVTPITSGRFRIYLVYRIGTILNATDVNTQDLQRKCFKQTITNHKISIIENIINTTNISSAVPGNAGGSCPSPEIVYSKYYLSKK